MQYLPAFWRVLLFLVLFSFGSFQKIDDTEVEDQAGDAIVSFKKGIPRINFNFEKVDNKFNPGDIDYQESMVMIGFLGFMMGILSVVFGFFYFVGRECLGVCGGRIGHPEGYGTKERYLPKQVILCIGLIVLGASILGYVANADLSESVDIFFEKIKNRIDVIREDIGTIQVLLRRTNGVSFDPAVPLEDLRAGAQRLYTLSERAQSEVDTYDAWRLFTINVGYIAASIAVFVGILGALLNLPFFCKMMALIGYFSLFFLWWSFSLHLPASVILADLCDGIDDLFEEKKESLNGLNLLIDCMEDDTFYRTDNLLIMLKARISDSSSQMETLSQAADTLEAIRNCSYVQEVFTEGKEELCVPMLQSLDLIMGTQGLIALVLIPGVVFAMIAYKRVNKPRRKAKTTSRYRPQNARKGVYQAPNNSNVKRKPIPRKMTQQEPQQELEQLPQATPKKRNTEMLVGVKREAGPVKQRSENDSRRARNHRRGRESRLPNGDTRNRSAEEESRRRRARRKRRRQRNLERSRSKGGEKVEMEEL